MQTHIPALRPHRRGRHAAPRSSPPSSRGSLRAAPHRLPHPPGSAVPATLALCYCLYAVFIAGDNGWSTGLSWLIGLVSAGVLGLVCFGVGRWQSGRQPETVAAVYGVVFGLAMGYLLSLNDDWSIFKSCGVGLALGACMAVAVYYVGHTHLRGLGRRRDGGRGRPGTRGRRPS